MQGSVFAMAMPLSGKSLSASSHPRCRAKEVEKGENFFAILKNEISLILKNGKRKDSEDISGYLSSILSLIQKLFPELTEQDLNQIDITKTDDGKLQLLIPDNLLSKLDQDLMSMMRQENTSQKLQSLIQKLFPELTEQDLNQIDITKTDDGKLQLLIPDNLLSKLDIQLSQAKVTKNPMTIAGQNNLQRELENGEIRFTAHLLEARRINRDLSMEEKVHTKEEDIANKVESEEAHSMLYMKDGVKISNEKIKIQRNLVTDTTWIKINKKENMVDTNNSPILSDSKMWHFKEIEGLDNHNPKDTQPALHIERSIEKIIDTTLRMIKVGTKEMIVKLEPPELGKMKIFAEMDKGIVNMKLQVEREDVRQMIEIALGDLKAQLEQSGIRSGDIMVWVKNGDIDEHSFSQQQERQKREKRQKDDNIQDLNTEVSKVNINSYPLIDNSYKQDNFEVWV